MKQNLLQNLKVTAIMLDGRIATNDGYLPFDAILEHGWIRKYNPEHIGACMELQDTKTKVISLPLKKINASTNDWHWACSFGCFKTLKEDRRYWHKRFDIDLSSQYIEFGKRRGAVDIKSGRFKNYRIPLTIFLVDKIDWYCVGDAKEISKLLPYVTHIGKKPAQGLGLIRSWSIEAIPEDLSWLRPTIDINGTDYIAIRTPYWFRENQRRVSWPNDDRLGVNNIYGGLEN